MKIQAKETKYLRFLRLAAIGLSVLFMAVQAFTQLLPYSPGAVHDGQLACVANGAYFAVAPDGRLVAWGSNTPHPTISYHSPAPTTPFFARRTMMKNVSEVYATGWAVFALDNNGTLWRWNDTHGNGGYLTLHLPFTDAPEKMLENVVSFDKKAGSENDFVAVTEDGGLYLCYQFNDPVQLSSASDASGLWDLRGLTERSRAVYLFGDSVFVVKDDEDLWAWQAPGGEDAFPIERQDADELYAVSAMGLAGQDDYRHTRLAVTLEGRLVWNGGSVPLGGLSPKWRDAALCFFLAAVLLRWAEGKRRE